MEKIPEILKRLETEHDIKILYALEAGSRAWRVESHDSDYDIRFIYKYNDTKKYLSLMKLKDCIDGFSEDAMYDWQGWDITKALKHTQHMNPSICEWFYSPIIYSNDLESNFLNSGRELLKNQDTIIPLLHHYRSMAKSNYHLHIQKNKEVKIKKYLYVIRPIAMFLWLMNREIKDISDFEINLIIILEDLKGSLDSGIYDKICEIIEKKKKMKELDLEPRISIIDNWIERILGDEYSKKLKELENNSKQKRRDENYNSLDKYDKVLFNILGID